MYSEGRFRWRTQTNVLGWGGGREFIDPKYLVFPLTNGAGFLGKKVVNNGSPINYQR